MLKQFPKNGRAILELIPLFHAGQVVAAPTETAYGLLADATNASAVREVVRLKGRSEKKPIALVASDLAMVRRYFRMTKSELRLAKKFWPGPLTLLLKPKKKFPKPIIGAGGRVGIRVPRSVWLRSLLKRYGKPLTATSANRTGGQTPYSAVAVTRQLKSHGLSYLVNSGTLPSRPTSTVVLVSKDKFQLIREGAIPSSKLRRVLG